MSPLQASMRGPLTRTAPEAVGGFLGNRWVAGGLVVVSFAIVFALRTAVYNPNDGLGMLFCIPIAIAAVRFGPAVGATAGIVGWLLFLAWAFTGDHSGVGAIGFASRAVVFLLLGAGIGHFARARAELDVRSRLLFDTSPDLMGTLALDGSTLAINDAWASLVSNLASPREVRGSLVAMFPPSGDSAIVERRAELAGDGAIDVEWHLRSDDARPLVYAVGRDVTERNRHVDQVRELLAAVQSARVDERNRIASELHDFVLQQLLVSLMHIEGDPALARTDERIRTAVGALRRIIDGIQPLDLQFVDVSTTLERAVEQVEREWGVTIQHEVSADLRLDEPRKILAYRLAGEALRNAAKHSSAHEIQFDARAEAGELVLEISDDGCGIGPDAFEVVDGIVPNYGSGFNLLLEQLLVDGGRSRIRSAPALGTHVELRISARSSR